MSVGVLFTSVSSKFAFDGRAVFEQEFQLSILIFRLLHTCFRLLHTTYFVFYTVDICEMS